MSVPKEVRKAIDQRAEGCAIHIKNKEIKQGGSGTNQSRVIADIIKDDSIYTEYTYVYRDRDTNRERKRKPVLFTARQYWMSGEVEVLVSRDNIPAATRNVPKVSRFMRKPN